MSAARVRLAISGCGRIVTAGYLPALRGNTEFDVVAVADPDAGRAREAADAVVAGGARRPATHADAGEMLDTAAADLLLVASPPSSHLHDAELASRAGIACVVEKPPACDAETAQRIAALDTPPWIGFNRRFQHGLALLSSLPRGRFDLACEIRYRRGSWAPFSVRDDALLDLGPHLVDLALFLGCSPAAEVVLADCAESRFELVLETTQGRATLRGATDRAYLERVAVTGRGGRRVATSVSGGRARLLAGRLPGTEIALVGSLRAQLAEAAAALRGAPSEFLATAEDGVRVMRIIDAARSAASAEAAVPDHSRRAAALGVADPA